VEFYSIDGFGGPMYIGTGCFHRRDTLCGRKFIKNTNDDHIIKEPSLQELEENSKTLASCSYEENTSWGKEVTLTLFFIPYIIKNIIIFLIKKVGFDMLTSSLYSYIVYVKAIKS
jgi:hypothetical protein